MLEKDVFVDHDRVSCMGKLMFLTNNYYPNVGVLA